MISLGTKQRSTIFRQNRIESSSCEFKLNYHFLINFFTAELILYISFWTKISPYIFIYLKFLFLLHFAKGQKVNILFLFLNGVIILGDKIKGLNMHSVFKIDFMVTIDNTLRVPKKLKIWITK